MNDLSAAFDVQTPARSDWGLFVVGLEDNSGERLCTHDLFVEAEEDETIRRAAMVAQLKLRVRAGSYAPNLHLIAARMLADLR